jgi:hypothetical protein
MTSIPVDLHRELATSNKAMPTTEPWTWRSLVQFTVIGLVLFGVLFGFMYALGAVAQ